MHGRRMQMPQRAAAPGKLTPRPTHQTPDPARREAPPAGLPCHALGLQPALLDAAANVVSALAAAASNLPASNLPAAIQPAGTPGLWVPS